MVTESRAPGAGESGPWTAAEGATGPRKRSGTKDRDGRGPLESRQSASAPCRTDEVRAAQAARIFQVPRQRGVMGAEYVPRMAWVAEQGI